MKSVYIIAEAGVNHNGDIGLARQLIDAAEAARADAVKFQTFQTEGILTRRASMAEYQKENLGVEVTQFQMIKALELTFEQFAELKAYAESIGIDFLSTPDDEDSLNFLSDELDLQRLKIGSGEVTNLPFLRKIAAKQRRMILSTGMATIGEVERAVRTIRELNQHELLLLHCTTNYPCPPEEVNLRAMQTMRRAFDVRVGYSDHTIGSEVPVAAVALGAELIEKHLTLDRNMEGPDHKASLNPAEFGEMVRQIRAIEVALGNGVKWPNPSEEKIKKLVRRRAVAACDLAPGTVLQWEHLLFKRADDGIYVDHADLLIGSRLRTAVGQDEPLSWPCVDGIAVGEANDLQTKTEVAGVTEVDLTPATMDDIDFLFRLKCEPDSVYWGGFDRAPEFASLKQHYEEVLRDGVKTILIIRWKGQPVGVISYRITNDGECIDLSINVSSQFAGKGIGRAALEKNISLLRAHHPSCRRIVTLVREDNTRSQRMLAACGFVLTDRFEEQVLDSDQKPIHLYTWVKELV
jgi:N,N'-diacetyllegionaminate synthase